MLDHFSISHATDGKTRCRIMVEPQKRRCDVTITIDSRIVHMDDEHNAAFRSILPAQWSEIAYWEQRASEIAKAWSPFWRGETAA